MLWLLGVLVGLAALAVAFVAWLIRSGSTPEQLAQVGAAVQAFRDAHAGAIEATRRPATHFTLEPIEHDDARASKVGGAPWWPPGEPLPEGPDGKPLALLAQVDLGALPAPMPGWPAAGLLQFFIALDGKYGVEYDNDDAADALATRRGHRVVYWPDASGPTQALVVAPTNALPMDPTQPLAMHFVAAQETISVRDHRFGQLVGGDTEDALARHAEVTGVPVDDLHDALGEADTGAGHKLGGYPVFTQDDPRRRTDLELLLQLDTDEHVMWGDAGVGNFFIAPPDLARGEFSRVFYSWDCA
jgi:uncharacterized protein YwqG